MRKTTPNKKTGTVRWSKYGAHAAQLFRYLYFKKYTRNEDDKFDGDLIYNDPTRQYHKLNRNSFYAHIEEIDQRVQAYRANGTGLGSAEFRRLVNLTKIPPPDDRGDNWQEGAEESKQDEDRALSSSDSDDSSYFGVNEQDEDLKEDQDDNNDDNKSLEEEQDKKMPPKKNSRRSNPRSLEWKRFRLP